MNPATRLTLVTLILIVVLHLLRFVLGVEVTVGGVVVPMWASLLAIVFFAGLAVGLWRDHRVPRPPAI